jgi:hypothetical protein
MRKRKCYNCQHASNAFKVHKLTHHHCNLPERQISQGWGWHTLQVYSDTCDKHELIQKEVTNE